MGLRLQITSPEILFSSIFLLLTFYWIAHGDADGVVRVVVTEESDALLPCSPSTRENLQDKLFDWKKVGQGGGTQHQVFMYDSAVHYDRHSGQSEQFKGRVSHFQNELKHGNASIVIRETKVIDSGSYICVFPRLQPHQTFHIELVVVGAAPEPCTSIVDVTELGVVLKCDVRGASPEPKVEWQDSEGSILHAEDPQVSERGGRYDVSIQTTVSNTSNNRFHCVATQQLIGHRVQANITVSGETRQDFDVNII
ncbi:butyrophilin-like protein 10 isoform X2 [Notothenia coriiceps]|uniref:Butyrophilin-like protein 10 isoform X2 n=1 Tax=Notothenia coriiceps TaxID=8208 RepID=A0A6I9N5K7_9TELE|nr:PREDICTED: butyrophilin-like protein 10 isoform X2 [Notothenia coriiceps]